LCFNKKPLRGKAVSFANQWRALIGHSRRNVSKPTPGAEENRFCYGQLMDELRGRFPATGIPLKLAIV
jgi:hypothetical protein